MNILHLNITHVPGKQEIHECYMRMYVHQSVTTFPYFDTHSVETALLKVLNDILVSIDEGTIAGNYIIICNWHRRPSCFDQ